MLRPLLLALSGLCCSVLPLAAQDLHYSQFYLNPQHFSPAATGMFEGSWRVAGMHRAQWRSVPVNYRSYAVSADWKAVRRSKSVVGVGIAVQTDKAGDGQLGWTQGGLQLSGAHMLGKNSALSAGFGIVMAQRSVNLSKLSFKNQWGPDGYDPGLPSREPLDNRSAQAPSLSAGLAWHYRAAPSRNEASIGLGAFHLNKPLVSLGDISSVALPIRSAFYATGTLQIRENADIVAFTLAHTMGTAKEFVFGAGMRQILTSGLANNTSLRATLGIRWGDAVIPALQLERNNWLAGISYDWNTSAFSEASNGRGGIEIAVIWRVVPVPVTKIVKCCPVF